MAPEVNLAEQLLAVLANGGQAQDTRREKKEYVDVPAKEGEVQRAGFLPFAHTTLVEGKKMWMADEISRHISRGVRQIDGTVRGGGNATYSTQTTGGGYSLPYGFETEWTVAGIPVPMGAIVQDAEDKGISRREGRFSLVMTKTGLLLPYTDDADGDDVFNARVLVTKGKQPYFVKITAQRRSVTGFTGLSGDAKFVEYEA